MSEAYETLLVTREPGGLVFCTLNRPQALNAMSPKLIDELHAFLDALHDDTDAVLQDILPHKNGHKRRWIFRR